VKYSFIMPYLNRTEQFMATLQSYEQYRDRGDWELIIIEDPKNRKSKQLHGELLSITLQFDWVPTLVLAYNREPCYNPAEMFNIGVAASGGEHVILTNPEIMHKTDILAGLDNQPDEQYTVCACSSDDPRAPWYAHSVHAPSALHFCSCLSKKLYRTTGGFDEAFVDGIACEDNDFVERVRYAGIPVVIADDLLVHHQNHDRSYFLDRNEWYRLRAINGAILQRNRGARR